MNTTTNKLLAAIAAYEYKCGTGPESVLEALWYDYSCRSPVDDGQIRAVEAKLSSVFEELSPDASDSLFDRIADLVNAYQRAAYLDGLRFGIHLMQELS